MALREPETGKRRSSRIPLDFYKRPDRIGRGRIVLALLALFLALGWWATGLARDGWKPKHGALALARASHGPLARVHATWDGRCDACHRPFASLHDRGASAESDAKCLACHDGARHHDGSSRSYAAEKTADVPACADCHRDHRGREASLVRLPDSDCTNCHANINAHLASGASAHTENVTAFPGNHPKVAAASKQPDPGRLKFNHARHLAPGMPLPKGGAVLTLAALDPADRERYRRHGEADSAPVQLDCASCHRLARDESSPPLSGGGHLEPISYERDCRACHKLTFDPDHPGWTARHGVQPEELRRELRAAYAGELLAAPRAKAANADAGSDPPIRLPGPAPRDEDEPALRQALEQAVGRAERLLLGGKAEAQSKCAECHEFAQGHGHGEGRELTTVVPPRIPDLWMPNARFDHVAHRALNCAECHAAAPASTTRADVLLPSLEACARCHAPASNSTANPGGASFDCTECHRYHDGDHPRRGLAARADLLKGSADARAFLLGDVKREDAKGSSPSKASPQ